MSLRDHRHDGFFVLRTPLLPFENVLRWAGAAELPNAVDAPPPSSDHYDSAIEHARQHLRSCLEDPVVQEACFMASPSLMGILDVWRRDPQSDKAQRVELSLTKYLLRMSSRCTPFGLFAGWSLGDVGKRTRLEVCPAARCGRYTRIDHGYLSELVDAVQQDEAVQDELSYVPNGSLYRFGARMRYVEVRTSKRLRKHLLMDVEPGEELELVLRTAASGARVCELSGCLEAEGFPAEEARAYVRELIQAGILSAELDPLVTGAEAIDELVDQLGSVTAATKTRAALAWTREQLHELDAAGLGAPSSRYSVIAERLRELGPEVDMARLFQVDMMKPAPSLELDAEWLAELSDAAEMLHSLYGEHRDAFENFKKSFEERYGEAEIPLSEVLDDENGVGFGGAGAEVAPLLEGIPLGGQGGESTIPFGRRQQLIQGKLCAALQGGAREIELTDEELAPLRAGTARAPLPDSVHIMASLLPERPGEPAAPRAVFLGASGPSGGRMLGRFCHSSPELLERVREHLRCEEASRPDAVFAEIAHLPEGRIGNILARPLLRQYELEYLGRSGAPPERVVTIDDLRVSVSRGRVVLRSMRLDREVIPRLSTAHNTSLRTTGVYRFLTALQSQGVVSGVGWDWGPARGAPYLPRVRYRRTILSLQKWNVPNRELPKPWKPADGARAYAEFLAWAQARGLPRFFQLVDGDHLLLVDQRNPLVVLAFLDEVEKRPAVTLRELYPLPDELACTSSEGGYTHEIIVPLTRRTPEPPAGVEAARPVARAAARTDSRVAFEPGSEWLYLKLYSGPATADRLLREVVAPVVRSSLDGGWCDRWFFLRYGDPEHHLRVRFHGEPTSLLGRVLPLFRERAHMALRSGEAWKLVVDTYRPEIERYGGPAGLELCEQAFHADSDAVLAVVQLLEGDEGLDLRWRAAARGLQAALDDVGFDAEQRNRFLSATAEDQARTFGLTGAARHAVQDKYRSVRRSLEAVLGTSAPANPLEQAVVERIVERSRRWKPLLERLHSLERTGELSQGLDSLLRSLLHMHVNRMLRASQRPQEALIYLFLRNHSESVLARERSRARREVPSPQPSEPGAARAAATT